MGQKKEFPNRKHPRLDHFDYRSDGAYFVTVCTQNRRCLLSRVVGRGLAPAETDGLIYTPFGEIAEQQLLLLQRRYPELTLNRYVIMPNHIHMLLILKAKAAGASPRPTKTGESCTELFSVTEPRTPTLMDIVCTYKSLTTRECKKCGMKEKLFQTSFYEHIIRGREDYENIQKYISENPIRWDDDELFAKEQ